MTSASAASAAILPFPIKLIGGLSVFGIESDSDPIDLTSGLGDAKAPEAKAQFYCLTLSLTKFLRLTDGAISQCMTRSLPGFQRCILTLRHLHCKSEAEQLRFARVKRTFAEVKSLLENTVDSENWNKSDRFNLYPLPLVEKLLAHYCPARVSKEALEAVRAFIKEHNLPALEPEAVVAPDEPAQLAADSDDEAGAGAESKRGRSRATLAQSIDHLSSLPLAPKGESKSKAERKVALPVSGFISGVPVIDLTSASTLALLAEREPECEQVLSVMVDNFSVWEPQGEEYQALREYGLRPREVSVTLQEQCQRFSEYRQEVWNWSRDPNQVTQKTVGNNIRVFLLFGGFVCHTTKRHRLKPAAFDMSVFGTKQIEAYIMDFLQVCLGLSLS
jgi:hypothetical protein